MARLHLSDRRPLPSASTVDNVAASRSLGGERQIKRRFLLVDLELGEGGQLVSTIKPFLMNRVCL